MAKAPKSRARSSNVMEEMKRAERRRNLITFGLVGLFVAGLLGSAVFVAVKEGNIKKNTEYIAVEGTTDDYGILIKPADLGGDAKADYKAKVTVYEDFSCPHCGEFEKLVNPTLLQLVADGRAEVEYRPVAFLNDDFSTRAASAAYCAYEEGGPKAWKTYAGAIFEKQSQAPSNNGLLDIADKAEVKVDEDCVKTEKYAPYVRKATEAFRDAKISGTPAVYINDELLEDYTPLNLVKKVDQANGMAAAE